MYFKLNPNFRDRLLEQAVRSLQERIEDSASDTPQHPSEGAQPANKNRNVFIVHGRDSGPKEAVARFLEQLKFFPIILHEQANKSRTIIEKIEAHHDVGFAVVLLTPDDLGGLKGEEQRPRSRQNVLLELGYFVGRLGRSHVCALHCGDVEIPSDWQGVLNARFDEDGAWKQALARELQSAGHTVDWNLFMGR